MLSLPPPFARPSSALLTRSARLSPNRRERQTFFMMTIATTIGYGTFAPSLPFGRSMVILFGSVTIVLFGLVSRPAVVVVEAIEARTELLLLRARRSEQPLSEQGQKMLKGASAMLLCHAVLMAAAVIVYLDRDEEDPLHEEWDYGTCYYFCFVTFSSIGLGDFSLGPADNSSYELGRLLVQALIIMFGMAAFNVATGACSDLVLPLGATFSSQLRAWAVQLGSRVATSCARSRDGKVELSPATQDPMAVPSTSWIVSGSARRPRTPSTAYASIRFGVRRIEISLISLGGELHGERDLARGLVDADDLDEDFWPTKTDGTGRTSSPRRHACSSILVVAYAHTGAPPLDDGERRGFRAHRSSSRQSRGSSHNVNDTNAAGIAAHIAGDGPRAATPTWARAATPTWARAATPTWARAELRDDNHPVAR